MIRKLVLIFLCCSSLALYADEVRLNSQRADKAFVLENKAAKKVIVDFSFLPVTTLDDVSNNEMSVLVSKFLVMNAVSVFYKKDKSVNFRNSRITTMIRKGNRMRVVWEIPFSDIEDGKVQKSRYNAELQKQILNTKEVFDNFRSGCFAELRLAEIYWLEQFKSGKSPSELRKRIQSAISKLKEKIDAEDTLFMSEKEYLKKRAESLERFLLEKLSSSQTKNCSERKYKKASDFISDAVFNPAYKNLLLSDHLLLSVGGIRIFQFKNGEKNIVSVGKVAFSRSQLNTERLAEKAAFNELNKYRSVEIIHFSEEKEKIVTTYSDSLERSTLSAEVKTWTRMEAASILRRLSKIGAWYSKDRKYFFIALGAPLDKSGI